MELKGLRNFQVKRTAGIKNYQDSGTIRIKELSEF